VELRSTRAAHLTRQGTARTGPVHDRTFGFALRRRRRIITIAKATTTAPPMETTVATMGVVWSSR
jgi:hypothetical protein